jgi:dTDP-glucose 4,6-dehydratase
VVIARCFAFVGPLLPLDAHFAAGNFVRDALDGDEIRVAGDGTPYRSYQYAADLAAWLWVLLVQGESGRAYNVGSEEAVSIRQLAEAVSAAARTIGRAPRVSIARQPNPAIASARYVPSTVRAREELGLECWIPLDEALKRTITWHAELGGMLLEPPLAR